MKILMLGSAAALKCVQKIAEKSFLEWNDHSRVDLTKTTTTVQC
jgi:hypothetical protein